MMSTAHSSRSPVVATSCASASTPAGGNNFFQEFISSPARAIASAFNMSAAGASAEDIAIATAGASRLASHLRLACEVVESEHAAVLALDARLARACDDVEDLGSFLSAIISEGHAAASAGRVQPTTLQNLQLLALPTVGFCGLFAEA